MLQSSEKIQINVEELRIIVNIIDVATQRGAFRAPELKGIGEYYEKIVSLIPKENNNN